MYSNEVVTNATSRRHKLGAGRKNRHHAVVACDLGNRCGNEGHTGSEHGEEVHLECGRGLRTLFGTEMISLVLVNEVLR